MTEDTRNPRPQHSRAVENHGKRSKLIRWETIKTICVKTAEVRKKTITVTAKMQKPIYQNDDLTEKGGWETISIFIQRNDKTIVYNYAEAGEIHRLLGEAMLEALPDNAKCETAFQAWREKKDAASYKGGGPRTTGKTERKKAAGKAGEEYHRQKKRERAQQERDLAHSRGAGSKKG